MLHSVPSVFAVEDEYQIMLYTDRPAYLWIKIGGRVFNDQITGVMRSATGIRRVTVPQKLLDEAGGYTLCVQPIRSRQSYCTRAYSVTEVEIPFCPVPENGSVSALVVADVHGEEELAVEAAKGMEFDFLILNGDILNESKNPKDFRCLHNVAARLTNGMRPVVCVRGNHETRGKYAEVLPDYLPLRKGGFSYFTFRLGSVWGLALDCGEDKWDDHREYGGSVRFEDYRREETEYIRKVVEQRQFDAEGINHRIIVCHIPFMLNMGEEFDIERELFTEWSLLIEKINPELFISAHTHEMDDIGPGIEELRIPISFNAVTASEKRNGYFRPKLITFR